MVAQQDQIDTLPTLFSFHRHEHQELAIYLLHTLAAKMAFKLKLQKASIQLLNDKPFAVLGFRRSRKHIFYEFYSATEINNARIIKTTRTKDGLLMNRVNIFTIYDVDDELINWTMTSNNMMLD